MVPSMLMILECSGLRRRSRKRRPWRGGGVARVPHFASIHLGRAQVALFALGGMDRGEGLRGAASWQKAELPPRTLLLPAYSPRQPSRVAGSGHEGGLRRLAQRDEHVSASLPGGGGGGDSVLGGCCCFQEEL